MDEIYKYIDENGIPFYFDTRVTLLFQRNEFDIVQKIELENDPTLTKILSEGSLIVSQHSHYGKIEPCFPSDFKLNTSEQIDVVKEWFKDTTGYILEEFQTLLELPVLPNSSTPFLLLVEDFNNEKRFVLAKNAIKGDLRIRKKFDSDGKLLSNWISTFGRIERIDGNVFIENEMNDMGEIKVINGNLSFSNYVYQYKLHTLSPIKTINGDLYLKNMYASLGSIEYIEGNLNLRKTTVKDLGCLKYVGGNILVSKSQKDRYSFEGIEVKGKIRFYNDNFNEGDLTLPQY